MPTINLFIYFEKQKLKKKKKKVVITDTTTVDAVFAQRLKVNWVIEISGH
jgi:hypothetical protein